MNGGFGYIDDAEAALDLDAESALDLEKRGYKV